MILTYIPYKEFKSFISVTLHKLISTELFSLKPYQLYSAKFLISLHFILLVTAVWLKGSVNPGLSKNS